MDDNNFRCELCNISVNSESSLEDHYQGKKHKKVQDQKNRQAQPQSSNPGFRGRGRGVPTRGGNSGRGHPGLGYRNPHRQRNFGGGNSGKQVVTEKCTLKVGNFERIPFIENDLWAYFERFGPVDDVVVEHKHNGFAFVTFKRPGSATTAAKMKEHWFLDDQLTVLLQGKVIVKPVPQEKKDDDVMEQDDGADQTSGEKCTAGSSGTGTSEIQTGETVG